MTVHRSIRPSKERILPFLMFLLLMKRKIYGDMWEAHEFQMSMSIRSVLSIHKRSHQVSFIHSCIHSMVTEPNVLIRPWCLSMDSKICISALNTRRTHQLHREFGKQYQSSIAVKVLLILPSVLRVILLHLFPKMVGRDVTTAARTLTPPPISCGLSQDENFFSSQKTELENSHRDRQQLQLERESSWLASHQ